MDSSDTVRRITSSLDGKFQLEKGTELYLFKYLIATKKIKVDMEKKIDINVSVDKIIEGIEFEGGKSYGKVYNS